MQGLTRENCSAKIGHHTKIRSRKKRLLANTKHHEPTHSRNLKPTTVIIKSPDMNLAGVNPVKLGKLFK